MRALLKTLIRNHRMTPALNAFDFNQPRLTGIGYAKQCSKNRKPMHRVPLTSFLETRFKVLKVVNKINTCEGLSEPVSTALNAHKKRKERIK